MKPTIKLEWRIDEDTHVVTNASYDAAYDMLKLDMLQDSIYLLQNMYQKELESQRKEFDAKRKKRESKNV